MTDPEKGAQPAGVDLARVALRAAREQARAQGAAAQQKKQARRGGVRSAFGGGRGVQCHHCADLDPVCGRRAHHVDKIVQERLQVLLGRLCRRVLPVS